MLTNVQDGLETNIDLVNKGIESVRPDFLQRFMVGRSNGPGASKHAGKMTDVNVWDFALTKDMLKKWTNCRYEVFSRNRSHQRVEE